MGFTWGNKVERRIVRPDQNPIRAALLRSKVSRRILTSAHYLPVVAVQADNEAHTSRSMGSASHGVTRGLTRNPSSDFSLPRRPNHRHREPF